MSSSVLPIFSSKSFIVSSLICRSLIHFEFIFAYGIRKCSNVILLYVAVQFSQYYLLKEISPGISLERMMLKLKLQYFGHLM